MLKHNYLQKDYTTNGVEKQLKIPFEIELKIGHLSGQPHEKEEEICYN